MRVLLTGSAVPPPPDGAWPGRDVVPAAAGPSLADVASWWSAHGAVDTVPLAASGPAFLDALAPVAPEVLAGVVPGPGGAEVPVAVRRRASSPHEGVQARTVVVDASQVPATGEAVVVDADGTPTTVPARSSTAVGHLLALAVDAARAGSDPGRVVLATGGSTSHDAGLGALLALAGEPSASEVAPARLADVVRAARAALGGTHLVAAVASDVPLLGLHGASATLDARGVDPLVAQHLERALGAVAHDVAAAVDRADAAGPGEHGTVGRDLLAGATAGRRLAVLPGAGSGGGLGFAVAALGGRLVPALRVVADDVGLDARLADADVVVVLADELGAHELGEGTVREVAGRAARHALPVVVVARAVVAGRREQAAAGLSGAYAWGDGDPRDLVERVARTWSRG
ncbi:glycerate kinase [Cellulosimicrobium sp. XJ-DQ-B-000]|uniref:glycerate kinase n=1 Tax=Cellulosimicrobium sp. XJ-DQ-B-000 TaxID=3072182 RepID=UPI0028077A5D|nr:glycerate kinase [Cellulosimicrobium sp. XJ-DQ-B-000]MDQ8041749.1 glycerate kinase [Cellulosimicrobium sp. XJ-DQ-B-000]